MKVNESSSPANLNIGGVGAGVTPATKAVRPQAVAEKAGAEAAPRGELSLTEATQAAFAGRPERVVELRNLVSSGTYTPQTQGATEKMIDGALSRPE